VHLQRLKWLDRQIDQLSQRSARALKKHEQAVVRLAEVPGFGIESRNRGSPKWGWTWRPSLRRRVGLLGRGLPRKQWERRGES
jgi:hypothetical protein